MDPIFPGMLADTAGRVDECSAHTQVWGYLVEVGLVVTVSVSVTV